MSASVYPELVSGRNDGFVQGPWEIQPGSTSRGTASCDLGGRILEVPLGDDSVSRIVRAHELMHIRVSPFRGVGLEPHREIATRALECAEELRVNTILDRIGFATTQLKDGSEKAGGRRIAQAGEWGEALRFLLAVLGTGAERDYLAGVRSVQPSWMGGMRAVRKRALSILDGLTADELGDTSLNEDGAPRGYVNVTVPLARIVESAGHAMVPVGNEALRQFRRSLEPGGRRAPSGRFADLVFDESHPSVYRSRTSGARRPRPSTAGTVLRYPGRLLTDDQSRAFSTKRARRGGLVVIDQSGSMNIAAGQLEAMLRAAPDAVIVGYSHRPGDNGGTPNAWILAAKGEVSTMPPGGNVGNGVDGPVLRWAISRRLGNEPLIWVTDGQVTDSNDHPNDELTEECAALVRKHRIRLIRELELAGRALACHSGFLPSDFGRVGRKILELQGISGL